MLKLKFFIYFLFYFLIFFIAGLYIFYQYKYPKLPDINKELYSLYPKDIILKAGGFLYLPEERFQHFLNFPVKKEKGVIRVGAFGDSHTFGEEVEKTATYPYYLQKLFDTNYPDQSIEVLNFGVGGASFSDQFFLWERYAQSYQLDYILLGPVGFYSRRNVRLTPPFSLDWDIPKNRFILTDGMKQVKEVHIQGNSVKERYENYYRFVPNWTMLRYDKQAFKLYEILFPFLRYKISNPFYYTKLSENEEAAQINKLLLKKINSIYPKKVLFFTNTEKIYRLYNLSLNGYQPKLYNFNKISAPTTLFYEVFWHESSLGNELTAQFYFNALLGKTKFFFNTIRCYFKDKDNSSNEPMLESLELDMGSQIEILGGKSLLFSLRENIADHHSKSGFYQTYAKKKIKSFLVFLNKNKFLRSIYIPLPFQLKEGMNLYVDFKGTNRIRLGEVKSLDVHSKFFAVYLNNMQMESDDFQKFVYLSTRDLNIPKKEGELFIESNKLGRLVFTKVYQQGFLKFIPRYGSSKVFLAMGPQDSVRESDFPAEFPVFIKYRTTNGKSFKSLIPDWTCRKEKQATRLDLPHFEALKL